jgi:acyl-CoA thioesterase-1
MNGMRRWILCGLALSAVSACSFRNVSCGLAAEREQAPAAAASTPAEQPLGASTPGFGISILGDSLTAGFGLVSQEAFPARLEEMFAAEGYDVDVLNAGLSGDTTAGGLRRVDQAIEPHTRILVIALGGNDALRGLTAQQTYANVAAIIEAALAKDVAVLLAGMQAPTNLGEDYQLAFRTAFERLSTEYARTVTWVPFLLEGVAMIPELNQPDGIHPNAEGARKIAELLYPTLRAMVDRAGGAGGG